jgi:integrase
VAGAIIVKRVSMVALVEDYLSMRRQLGFALKIQGHQLLHFGRFADDVEHCGPITLDLAVQWARSNAPRPITWTNRIKVLRPFAKYRAQFDPTTEIPPPRPFGLGPRRLVPHIYSAQELQSLLAAAAQLPPAGGLRPATYETLFGLLAATGLRISEALRLTIEDVDLEAGIITVRDTKFGKSRLVPLHSTATEALRRYARLRNVKIPVPSSDDFFLSDGGRRMLQDTVQRRFRRLCDQLHWRSRGGHPAPRIHDLRHSFITHCILRWYQQGVNPDKEILALSTYVGHSEVTYTYWYITGVPELLAIVTQRFEQYSAGI